MLAQALPQLERNIHPVVIIQAYKRALADALEIIDEIAVDVDINNDEAMYQLINASIGTKFVSRWSELMCNLALKAVRTVSVDVGSEKKEVDIKRYARIEKIPGGEIEDSQVLDGVMLNKDITHPKMRRRIENPKVLLLDCPLEYKKGESQTNIEISKEEDWNRILQIEEEQVKAMCESIIALKPDLVITEKGVSGMFVTLQHHCSVANACRPCTTLPRQAQHHCYSSGTQDRQQPYCASNGRDHCKLCFLSCHVGHWHSVRSFRDFKDRRRILHFPHQVQRPQSLHNTASRSLQRHLERDRAQPPRCHGRRAKRHLESKTLSRRWRD